MEEKRKWLKEHRDSKKLRQEEVAQLSNIERAYYTMIENGNRTPSPRVAKDIAKTLHFDWTIFFEN